MAASYRFTFRPSGLREIHADVDRGIARVAGQARDEARKIIKEEGRIDTGALWQSIEVVRMAADPAGLTTYEVGSRLHYAMNQHEGVKGPIYPKRARVLRFKPKGARGFVFATKVNGFEGIHFLTRALERININDL